MAKRNPIKEAEREDSTPLVLDITLGDEHRLPSGEWKLSAALLSVSCPLRQGLGIETGDQLPTILGLALKAWNDAVAPEIAVDLPEEWSMRDAPPAVREHIERVSSAIRQLKSELHPSDRRVITRIDIENGSDGALVLVVGWVALAV